MEIAVGGGNPLAHPQLEEILQNFHYRGWIANLTVNQTHINDRLRSLVSDRLVYGVGISVTNPNVPFVSKHAVHHLIAGLHTSKLISELIASNRKQDRITKILILGYKQYGKGKPLYDTRRNFINKNIYKLSSEIWKLMKEKDVIVSFDNLALRQLNIGKVFNSRRWHEMYMGDDGTFTMYVDSVTNQFAVSSTSQRVPAEITLLDFFTEISANNI